MAPEYALRGYLTDKADVYSYGIVLLEIVSGMVNTVDRTKQNHFILLDLVIDMNLFLLTIIHLQPIFFHKIFQN